MKTALSLVIFTLFHVFSAYATTYYSINNSSPNSTNSWRTSRNGTGFTPWDFENDGDIFIVQAGHTITTTANWNVSGNNSKIVVEAGATLHANHKIKIDIFQLLANGTYIHNDNSSAFPGEDDILLAATSTVEINDWNGSAKLPADVSWGNLIIDLPGYNSNLNQAGDLTDIAGNFIIRSTGNNKELRLATSQDYTLTIGGDLIIEGGILEASSSNGSADQVIIINGSFIQSGGTFTRSNNNIVNPLQVQFNGANSNFTKTGGTLTNTYINWKVNASKTLKLNNDLPVALLRSFTVTGTVDVGTKGITGLGAFTLSSTGKMIVSNTQGLIGTLTLTGLTTLTNGASYEFLASTTTPFPTLLASVNATNVTIGADVTFNKNTTITGTLTLNSGKATIPAGTTVTISSGNAIGGSGFSATKHIVTQVNTSTGTKGYIRMQNFTGARTFPIGNGTYYLPVTLTPAGTNDFTLCAFPGLTSNGQPNGTAFTASQKKTCVDAVWHVNRNGGSGDVMMQLAWPAALEGSIFQNLANNQLGIAHYGTYWETAFGTGNQTSNIATRTAIVSFSPFAVGLSSVPLPLKFGDIKAYQKDNAVEIDWYSFTETDLDHYEVERSTDGKNFIKLADIACAGNSTTRKDYSWNDHINTEGIFFYRVKAIDIDSRFVYSSIIRISITRGSQEEMVLYPNPVMDKRINVQATYLPQGNYKLTVFDQRGSSIYHYEFDHRGGAISQQVTLPPSLPAGIYNLSLSDGKEIKMAKTFIVR